MKEQKKLKLIIVSDTHLMSPALLINDGEAFENYLIHDRKMLKESPAILNELKEQIINYKPDAVLIPGDLTKDGEMLSHQYFKDNFLVPLKELGIKSYVTPGNHDINNPWAKNYDHDKSERVETIKAEDFSEFYADFGYDNALERCSHSLSYAAKLSEDSILLSIDACRYQDNDFDANINRYEGRIQKPTLEFIERILKMAKDENKKVIAMMHHGLLNHWKYQNKLLAGYLIEDNKKIAKRLEKKGLKVIFTGHYHAQDVAKKGNLYDVQTGSTVSFPSVFRTAELTGNQLKIDSFLIEKIDYNLSGVSLYNHLEDITYEGIKTVIADYLIKAKIPKKVTEIAAQNISKYSLRNHLGDERITDEDKAEIKSTTKLLRKHSWKLSFAYSRCARALLDGEGCPDNSLSIKV